MIQFHFVVQNCITF